MGDEALDRGSLLVRVGKHAGQVGQLFVGQQGLADGGVEAARDPGAFAGLVLEHHLHLGRQQRRSVRAKARVVDV